MFFHMSTTQQNQVQILDFDAQILRLERAFALESETPETDHGPQNVDRVRAAVLDPASFGNVSVLRNVASCRFPGVQKRVKRRARGLRLSQLEIVEQVPHGIFREDFQQPLQEILDRFGFGGLDHGRNNVARFAPVNCFDERVSLENRSSLTGRRSFQSQKEVQVARDFLVVDSPVELVRLQKWQNQVNK